MINSDIIGILETHLDNNNQNQPSLDGYRWFGHCRNIRHIRSNLTYGGIGIFIREALFQSYDIKILDKSYEGILSLLLKDKVSNYTFTIYCCYLAPENSPYGRNSTEFYNHLLSLTYLHNYVDASFYFGDLNSRLGDKPDVINDIDTGFNYRHVIDFNCNKHGDALLDFLVESRLVILNGRIPNGNDNFTSISSKGRAVVDYIFVPHENLRNCSYFSVDIMSDIISKYSLEPMISTRCKAPDHSILTLKYVLYDPCHEIPIEDESMRGESVSKKYDYGTMSNEFMNSPSWVAILDNLISRIEFTSKTQNKVDELYESMLSDIFQEMDSNIEYRSASKRSRKHYKTHKPFWNLELTEAWKSMNKAEKLYIGSKKNDSNAKTLRNVYLSKRKIFDKLLRSTERKYYREKALEIESINTTNPTEFWKYINSLGPKRKSDIPMEVYDDSNTNISTKTNNQQAVLNRWKNEFHDLYNMPDDVQETFDNSFYDEIMSQLPTIKQRELTNTDSHDVAYNNPFTLEEIDKIRCKMKTGKAVGCDAISNEVLKNEGIRELILSFANMCYLNNVIPSIWRNSIISPIPKSSTKDPCVPLNYRGISLLSCFYKLYTSLLNMRLAGYCEGSGYLVDEQNGFRSGRSCQDHIFTLSSLIRNQKLEGKDTHCAFVDFRKAFDWVPRDLLLYKLSSSFDVHGRLFNSISTILESSSAQIRLNGLFTDPFKVTSGVKQGDIISPLLFSLYLNDLATGIKSLNCGIDIGTINLAILLYADDIALIAPDEHSLQEMISYVNDWCKKWRMAINTEKTQIVHFRSTKSPITDYNFYFGGHPLSIVSYYKYLGVIFDEHLTFDMNASTLSKASLRALGGIKNKLKNLKECGYKSFCTLFNSCVTSISDYSAGIWSMRTFPQIEQIQYQAARYYLGVHRFAPIEGLLGDMGWCSARVRHNVLALKQWNRMCNLDVSRTTRKVFEWDLLYSNKIGAWSCYVRQILESLGCSDNFNTVSSTDITSSEILLKEIDIDRWNVSRYKDKLRYYNMFKYSMETEEYLSFNITRYQRSLMAQFRLGILPLEIEVGRYRNIPLSNRVCHMCAANVVEDEIHFLCECASYSEYRLILFSNAEQTDPDFSSFDLIDKFVHIMSNHQKSVIKFLTNAVFKRINSRYTQNSN